MNNQSLATTRSLRGFRDVRLSQTSTEGMSRTNQGRETIAFDKLQTAQLYRVVFSNQKETVLQPYTLYISKENGDLLHYQYLHRNKTREGKISKTQLPQGQDFLNGSMSVEDFEPLLLDCIFEIDLRKPLYNPPHKRQNAALASILERLKTAQFDEAIKLLNQYSEWGIVLPLEAMNLVLKKFHHERYGSMDDANRLYDIIRSKFEAEFTRETLAARHIQSEMTLLTIERSNRDARLTWEVEDQASKTMFELIHSYLKDRSSHTFNVLLQALSKNEMTIFQDMSIDFFKEDVWCLATTTTPPEKMQEHLANTYLVYQKSLYCVDANRIPHPICLDDGDIDDLFENLSTILAENKLANVPHPNPKNPGESNWLGCITPELLNGMLQFIGEAHPRSSPPKDQKTYAIYLKTLASISRLSDKRQKIYSAFKEYLAFIAKSHQNASPEIYDVLFELLKDISITPGTELENEKSDPIIKFLFTRSDTKIQLSRKNYSDLISALWDRNLFHRAYAVYQEALGKGVFQKNQFDFPAQQTNFDLHVRDVLSDATLGYDVLPYAVVQVFLHDLGEKLIAQATPCKNKMIEIVCGQGKNFTYRDMVTFMLEIIFDASVEKRTATLIVSLSYTNLQHQQTWWNGLEASNQTAQKHDAGIPHELGPRSSSPVGLFARGRAQDAALQEIKPSPVNGKTT